MFILSFLFFISIHQKNLAQSTTIVFSNTTSLPYFFNVANGTFTYLSTGGISNLGCVNVSNLTDICTYKTAINSLTPGSRFMVGGYFYNASTSGYGGFGFSTSSTNAYYGNCESATGLGLNFQTSSGAFVNNGIESPISWTSALSANNWYQMLLFITYLGNNEFDMEFQLWTSDADGITGTLVSDNILENVVNSQIATAGKLYIYFASTGTCFSKFDRFMFSDTQGQLITMSTIPAQTYGNAPLL